MALGPATYHDTAELFRLFSFKLFIHSYKKSGNAVKTMSNYIILSCLASFYVVFAYLAHFNLIADAALSHTNYAIINKRKYIFLSTKRHTKCSTYNLDMKTM